MLGTDLKTTVTLDATATTRAFTADSTTELYIYGVDPADGTTVINTSLTSVDVKDTKTIYGSTEDFPWGGSETTYYVNGQVIGYSGLSLTWVLQQVALQQVVLQQLGMVAAAT